MNSSNKNNVLILFSGGIDSTALIKYYLNLDYKVFGLFVDYGQLANNQELKAVNEIAKFYGFQIKVVNIGFNKNFDSGEIIGRNALLLNIALVDFPFDNGIVALGIHDGTTYNDCTIQFIKYFQEIYDLYKDGQIIVEAPFINMSKKDIWDFNIINKVPIELTYSCENGKELGCGKCLSCIDKKSLYELSKEQ